MFYKEGQTLYLSVYHYNLVLILEELKKLVIENGGKVKQNTHGFIVNRSILEALEEKKNHLEWLKKYMEEHTDKQIKTDSLQAEIERLEAADNAPVSVSNTGYISFILDGFHYYIQKSEYSELQFRKAAILDGGKVSREYPLDLVPIDNYCLHVFHCTLSSPEIETYRKEAAKALFEYLTGAKETEKVIYSKRVRVANRYNGGYHYETVKEKEQFEALNMDQYTTVA